MCDKRSGLVVHVAVAKASLAGGDRVFQTASAQRAINSRMLLYEVTHCYNNSNRYRL